MRFLFFKSKSKNSMPITSDPQSNAFLINSDLSSTKLIDKKNKINCQHFKSRWQILTTLCCYKCSSESKLEMSSSNDYHTTNKSSLPKSQENFETKSFLLSSKQQQQKRQTVSISSTKQTDDHNVDNHNITNNETNSSIHFFNDLNSTYDTNVCVSSPLSRATSSGTDSPRLYPPGRILHVVRKYPRIIHHKNNSISSSTFKYPVHQINTSEKFKASTFLKNLRNSNKSAQALPVYQVIETDNNDFNEILISPRMMQDHMPDNLIKCMKAVLEDPAPRKPPRQISKPVINSDLPSYDDDSFKDSFNYSIDTVRINEMNKKVCTKILDQSSKEQVRCDQLTPANFNHNESTHQNQKCKKFPIFKNVSILKQYQNFISNTIMSRSPLSKRNKPSIIAVDNETHLKQSFNQIKSPSVVSCDYKANLTINNAPLAKPESISDILTNFDDSSSFQEPRPIKSENISIKKKNYSQTTFNNSMTNDNNLGYSNKLENNITYDYYYDDSINFKNPSFHLHNMNNTKQEETNQRLIKSNCSIGTNKISLINDGDENETKSSLIWWSYPNDQPNSGNNKDVPNFRFVNSNGINKLKKNIKHINTGSISSRENKTDEYDDQSDDVDIECNENRDHLINSNLNELIDNRMSTSTPRADSKIEKEDFGKSNESVKQNNGKDNDELKKTDLVLKNNVSLLLHYSALSTSYSTTNNFNDLDGKRPTDSNKMTHLYSTDTFGTTATTSSNFNNSNYDLIETSSSFSFNNCTNGSDDENNSHVNTNKGQLTNPIKNNQNGNSSSLINETSKHTNQLGLINNVSKHDDSINTNYTSIEKLAIIKPQSKDYILCFDTSSIDQNSTSNSNELFDDDLEDNNKNNLLSKSELMHNTDQLELEYELIGSKNNISNGSLKYFNTSLSSDGATCDYKSSNGKKKSNADENSSSVSLSSDKLKLLKSDSNIDYIVTDNQNNENDDEMTKNEIMQSSIDHSDSGIDSSRMSTLFKPHQPQQHKQHQDHL